MAGKIRCPDCDKAMIGMSAKGRSKTYRYYTCFTRARYGTQQCSAPRLNADGTDRAVLAAMRDFYAHHTDLIAQAVADARAFYTAGHAERIAEHDMISSELAKANTAVERYFTAFENGTMSEETAAPRLDKLSTKIKQLRQRRDELAEELDGEPTMPEPAELAASSPTSIKCSAATSPHRSRHWWTPWSLRSRSLGRTRSFPCSGCRSASTATTAMRTAKRARPELL